MSTPALINTAVDVAMANFTLSIDADSGYQQTTEGRCTPEQYGAAMAVLHGRQTPAEKSVTESIEMATEYVADPNSNLWEPLRCGCHYLVGSLQARNPEVAEALLKFLTACDTRSKAIKEAATC